MVEQILGSAGIFAENQIGGFQYVERTKGYVFEIPYRGWNNKQFCHIVID
jgi:hypothetical protein